MKRAGLLAAMCVLIATSVARGGAPIMKLDDVRPGMKGVMRTVFEGTKIEEVPIEVVDVIRRIGPGRDVIIVRLFGKRIEKTGVARGMSGSPVYVQDKLIGALAFAWPRLKEPVAGVTPIEAMMRVKRGDAAKAVAATTTWRRGETIPSHALMARLLAPRPATPFVGPANMHALRTPIAVSGFSEAAVATLGEHLRAFDVAVVQAGAAGADRAGAADRLRPGGSVCVQLMRGDVEAAAIGTVTEVDGKTVYAFGHPLMNSGRIALPMTTARVHMIVASREISFKLASAGKPVGTLWLDHTTGIVGELGEVPDMLPVSLEVKRQDLKGDTTLNFEIIRDPRLLLSLLNGVMRTVTTVSGKPDTEVRMIVKATIDVEGYEPVTIEEVYGGPQAPAGAAGALVMPLGHLLHNPFKPVSVKSVRIATTIIPGDPRALIRYAETDKEEYHPGDDVDVALTLQPWRKEITVRHFKVKLPDDLPEGNLMLMVCDASTDSRMESMEKPHLFRPRDVASTLDFFRRRRLATDVVFRLSRRSPGMVLKGRELPELPPSVISVLGKQPPTEISQFTTTTITRVPTEFIILGRHQLPIRVVKD